MDGISLSFHRGWNNICRLRKTAAEVGRWPNRRTKGMNFSWKMNADESLAFASSQATTPLGNVLISRAKRKRVNRRFVTVAAASDCCKSGERCLGRLLYRSGEGFCQVNSEIFSQKRKFQLQAIPTPENRIPVVFRNCRWIFNFQRDDRLDG